MNVMTMFSPLKHRKGRDLLLNGFSIKGTVTRSHCYTTPPITPKRGIRHVSITMAPPQAPKRGIRHVIGILDGLVLSSMPFCFDGFSLFGIPS